MRYFSRRVGATVGLAFGVLGLVAGLFCGWLGLESQPHTELESGMILGSLGMLDGLTCAFFGVTWRRISLD